MRRPVRGLVQFYLHRSKSIIAELKSETSIYKLHEHRNKVMLPIFYDNVIEFVNVWKPRVQDWLRAKGLMAALKEDSANRKGAEDAFRIVISALVENPLGV